MKELTVKRDPIGIAHHGLAKRISTDRPFDAASKFGTDAKIAVCHYNDFWAGELTLRFNIFLERSGRRFPIGQGEVEIFPLRKLCKLGPKRLSEFRHLRRAFWENFSGMHRSNTSTDYTKVRYRP